MILRAGQRTSLSANQMNAPGFTGAFLFGADARACSQRMRKTKMGVSAANGHSFDWSPHPRDQRGAGGDEIIPLSPLGKLSKRINSLQNPVFSGFFVFGMFRKVSFSAVIPVSNSWVTKFREKWLTGNRWNHWPLRILPGWLHQRAYTIVNFKTC